MNNVIVKDTLEAWQPHYQKTLTENDGKEIQNNLIKFTSCLQDWQRERAETGDTRKACVVMPFNASEQDENENKNKKEIA